MRRQSELSIRAQITVGRSPVTSIGQRSSIVGFGDGRSSYSTHGYHNRAPPSMGLTVFNYTGPDSVLDRSYHHRTGYSSPAPSARTYLSSIGSSGGEFLRPGAYLASTASSYGRMTASRRYETSQPSRTRIQPAVASGVSYTTTYQRQLSGGVERQSLGAESGRQQRLYRPVDDRETEAASRRARGFLQGD